MDIILLRSSLISSKIRLYKIICCESSSNERAMAPLLAESNCKYINRLDVTLDVSISAFMCSMNMKSARIYIA